VVNESRLIPSALEFTGAEEAAAELEL
jgi:hypothetical protein